MEKLILFLDEFKPTNPQNTDIVLSHLFISINYLLKLKCELDHIEKATSLITYIDHLFRLLNKIPYSLFVLKIILRLLSPKHNFFKIGKEEAESLGIIIDSMFLEEDNKMTNKIKLDISKKALNPIHFQVICSFTKNFSFSFLFRRFDELELRYIARTLKRINELSTYFISEFSSKINNKGLNKALERIKNCEKNELKTVDRKYLISLLVMFQVVLKSELQKSKTNSRKLVSP